MMNEAAGAGSDSLQKETDGTKLEEKERAIIPVVQIAAKRDICRPVVQPRRYK